MNWLKKVGFYTLGCKVNQYETQSMEEMFKKSEYEIVKFEDYADVYVINTCTVTSFGDKKSRQIIRRTQKTNPNAVVAVVGCYSQIAPEEIEKIREVDVIAGTTERNKIVELVENASKEKKLKLINDVMKQRVYEDIEFITTSERTRAFIKIQDGCDNFCTYCIIPYTRGPVRSRKLDSILQEIKILAQNGFKEIVLTGIHLTSYGKDIENCSLIDVIQKVDEIPGIERIRLGSLEPNKLTEDLIAKIKGVKSFCPHFHISLQSGSDSVLKRMKRKYTLSDYSKRIDMIRRYFDDASITTDIIVGFPGETDEEFKETYGFLNKISFAKTHVFKYSPRKGTPAESFPNQVDNAVKEERSNLIIKLSDKKEYEFQKRFLNTTTEVLFEQEWETDKNYLVGHTKNYLRVAALSGEDQINRISLVNADRIENGILVGELIN